MVMHPGPHYPISPIAPKGWEAYAGELEIPCLYCWHCEMLVPYDDIYEEHLFATDPIELDMYEEPSVFCAYDANELTKLTFYPPQRTNGDEKENVNTNNDDGSEDIGNTSA